MNRGNFFRRGFFATLIAFFFINTTIANAGVYIGEGSYVMSEGENLGVSKERAKADAMRNATEKAGVYVKSYSRSINFELDEDVIETITANILKLVEDPKFLPYEQLDNLEGLMIRVIVNVQIDDSDIISWLNKGEQEKSELVAQNEALRKANEEQARQIAELKRQIANNPQDTERITKEFANKDKIFLSNQKVSEAWQCYSEKNFNEAIKIFTEAIELNPENALAYYGRAYAYDDLEDYQRAIEDCTNAIQFDSPRLVDAYNNRGEAYRKSGIYAKAIEDYNKAIELNSNYFRAYSNRGIAYRSLGNYDKAFTDYNKAIELNPNYQYAYNNRGWAYYCLKQYEQALKDFDKALELNPNFIIAKSNREACLKAMGK